MTPTASQVGTATKNDHRDDGGREHYSVNGGIGNLAEIRHLDQSAAQRRRRGSRSFQRSQEPHPRQGGDGQQREAPTKDRHKAQP